MNINPVNMQSFGLAKLSPELKERIKMARAENMSVAKRAQLEADIAEIKEILPRKRVTTEIQNPHPVLSKVLPIAILENIYVDGRFHRQIEYSPIGLTEAKRLQHLLKSLRDIAAPEEEDPLEEFLNDNPTEEDLSYHYFGLPNSEPDIYVPDMM